MLPRAPSLRRGGGLVESARAARIPEPLGIIWINARQRPSLDRGRIVCQGVGVAAPKRTLEGRV